MACHRLPRAGLPTAVTANVPAAVCRNSRRVRSEIVFSCHPNHLVILSECFLRSKGSGRAAAQNRRVWPASLFLSLTRVPRLCRAGCPTLVALFATGWAYGSEATALVPRFAPAVSRDLGARPLNYLSSRSLALSPARRGILRVAPNSNH